MTEAPPVGDPSLVELQRTLYDSKNPTRRWMHRERLAAVSEAIRTAAASGPCGRALEVGPGAGPYVGTLCDLFDDVVATDIESQFLDYVRTVYRGRGNLTLIEDDIARSGLQPASFDLVLCSEVIEHTPDPAAVLQAIAVLLRPGGTLVLTTPQAYSTVELLGRIAFKPGIIQVARAIYREPILPTGHISLLTRARLARMLDNTGFEVKRTAFSGLYVPVLAEFGGNFAARIARRLAALLGRGPLSGVLWTQHWTVIRAR